MTVSDTRASATLGVSLGVRMRGVAYDDLQAAHLFKAPVVAKLAMAELLLLM